MKFTKGNMKISNDPIHGSIELHPLLVKIIDTPQFQRLRHIKQLGAGYWVYPGASHNRFEHSIGVAHLAERLVKRFQEKQPELNITNRDSLCVQIAGLCHDLGHGPFSHLYDNMFIPEAQPGSKWKHEDASFKMLEHMVEENKLRDEMKKYDMNPDEDLKFIKELILGVDTSAEKWPEKRARTEDKSFLYEIVSNKRNGIDVDKWDYFARDCHHLGISKSFDHERLLKLTRVCKVKIKELQKQKVETQETDKERLLICFRDKEADNIYDMFRTRYTLHRQAYQHKTVNIIEIMIKEALLFADDHFKISAAKDDMPEYTKLTDAIFETILHIDIDSLQLDNTEKKKLQDAKDKVEKIVKRDLPKFVGEARLPEREMPPSLQNILKDNWVKAMEKETKEDAVNPDDYVVDVVQMDIGMKGKNPTDNVFFYSKWNPNEAFKMDKKKMSSFLPERFYEKLVRVYYRGGTDDILKTAKECFKNWSENNFGL
ncbi:deoxynucleoside triphosphate triphosphohydrolase SAMHD1-like isoform X2 [Xyrauchen texanus]|uniref:deoxynucleoside triphosphate triphosphohydrolase SAMHD1-like isoform X2 n=1 Tax=Xyrauchen texanus TaxID=154827 RepID=UPI002242BE43|nr:deoxynucleoside triphosphate triphosphohydrolase SAMHD1-like isoform X2 [Xyrauchen texanus]XP_051992964.1 deoxynucleoside triphosphate triphosphohydrolase SAMHD1-like isoform X2 [Xyrauchen texanus]